MQSLRAKLGRTQITVLIVIAFVIITIGSILAFSLPAGEVRYSMSAATADSVVSTTTITSPAFIVTHIPTPENLKAVYFTSWAAGSDKFRKELYDLVDNTEINAVVIDVKDYTGRISFPVEDPRLKATGAAERRIPDIKEFINELHQKGVYVIARISSFQDSYLINIHPEWAVKTESGQIWKDYKGVKWLDAGAEPVWQYLVAIGREAYSVGFDELNFDYIRFPSDGNLKDISYSWGRGRSRAQVLEDFFKYLHKEFSSSSIPISADLFGLTTSAVDDLGIGQVLEKALPYFDYIYPMVYPSHYSAGFYGYKKPAEHPYEVIKYSMESAIQKANSASTSPMKIRPWLQAFDLGAVYTPAMVRAQIQATYDTGLNSWLLWNAGSVYNKSALTPKNEIASVGAVQ